MPPWPCHAIRLSRPALASTSVKLGSALLMNVRSVCWSGEGAIEPPPAKFRDTPSGVTALACDTRIEGSAATRPRTGVRW